MKKLYFFLFFVFGSIIAFAQVSVTATAGVNGPTIYASLQETTVAINNGIHQGDIIISIGGNVIETLSPTFVQSGTGAATYTSITIRPAAGTAATVTGNISGPLLDFIGADNVNIDGLNNGGSSLVFSNTSLTGPASCIRFTEGATNNNIQNCSLLSAAPSTVSGTIFFAGSSTTGNSNNNIRNNQIADATTGTPANAIYA
ncbi:MAG: hypothetical protein EOO13_05010, partial [Chitinophagaceae bacterium]